MRLPILNLKCQIAGVSLYSSLYSDHCMHRGHLNLFICLIKLVNSLFNTRSGLWFNLVEFINYILLLYHPQVLTKDEFVHLPPGEVDSQQEEELDNDYVKE